MAIGPIYQIDILPRAQRDIRALSQSLQERIIAAIRGLANEPRPRGYQKLAGAGDQYRIRVGDYRIIYEIHDGRLVVEVVAAGHRRDVYRRR